MAEEFDEGGLPVHLPMPVNADGQGPLDDSDPEIDHWVCWCGDDDCSWNSAFRKIDQHYDRLKMSWLQQKDRIRVLNTEVRKHIDAEAEVAILRREPTDSEGSR